MGEIEIFSKRMKQLRESFKMTQTEFSQFIGIKQQTLSGYERGIMKPPLDIAKTIAETCNVSIDWLCGLTDKKKYNDKIETYSDMIDILNQLKHTEIGMEILTFPIPELDSLGKFAAIIFDNKQACRFLCDYEQILEVENNSIINEHLYNLWIKDALKEYHTKIKSDEIIATHKNLSKFTMRSASKEEQHKYRKQILNNIFKQ